MGKRVRHIFNLNIHLINIIQGRKAGGAKNGGGGSWCADVKPENHAFEKYYKVSLVFPRSKKPTRVGRLPGSSPMTNGKRFGAVSRSYCQPRSGSLAVGRESVCDWLRRS